MVRRGCSACSLRRTCSSSNSAVLWLKPYRGGVQKLHLSMVSAVQVWSVDGHPVARC